MADAQGMKDIYTRLMNSVAKGDLEAVGSVLADDYSYHGNAGEQMDRAGVLDMIGGYVTAFPDMEFTIHSMATEGDQLFARWSVSGTNTGPMGEMPATGKSVDMPGHIVIRFAGDLIAEEWELFDEALMLKQLGVA